MPLPRSPATRAGFCSSVSFCPAAVCTSIAGNSCPEAGVPLLALGGAPWRFLRGETESCSGVSQQHVAFIKPVIQHGQPLRVCGYLEIQGIPKALGAGGKAARNEDVSGDVCDLPIVSSRSYVSRLTQAVPLILTVHLQPQQSPTNTRWLVSPSKVPFPYSTFWMRRPCFLCRLFSFHLKRVRPGNGLLIRRHFLLNSPRRW